MTPVGAQARRRSVHCCEGEVWSGLTDIDFAAARGHRRGTKRPSTQNYSYNKDPDQDVQFLVAMLDPARGTLSFHVDVSR